MADIADVLAEKVRAAAAAKTPLAVQGTNSRHFLGRAVESETLSIAEHAGIIDYEPRELVITARAGTPLAEIEAALDAAGQMLAFEPPRFSAESTLGGAIASGLSGPRRAYAGAVRDFVLGCRVVNGKGEILKFGGQVMKNVAGYDVSRLMTGAYGTLGVLLDVSLKVLPKPAASLTLVREYPVDQALRRMRELAGKPWPVDASCHLDGRLYLRLSGSPEAVETAKRRLGGEVLAGDELFWQHLRDWQLPMFNERPFWRLSLPAAAPMLPLDGEWLIEWGGAQRWLKTEQEIDVVRQTVADAGGHATLIGDQAGEDVFHPLPPALLALHRQLKQAFDPANILNPGRLYPEL
ncbi:glycolate oxidase FAD binding subunit [Novimethylophilus kurashikiensis]|uniref:Glycolate oxidase FAD binding subunit n=1 Tax=Novimethylophilus kurashikiensis TaxID=1825523 RepID=A0A2R5FBY6_9PROT|nr:glycolate oxidase subunit GlcE [Novimethylophilus kurashikiensis]GBG15732.1 glycolate oxidase FAD binding subunit [Novimethylophilus kurashikiensis]